jgi:dihydroneopterin aldolase
MPQPTCPPAKRAPAPVDTEPKPTVWNPAVSHQCLALRDVRVAVRLGVRADERAAPQLVSVDVELYRRQGRFAGRSVADCLDYGRVFDHLATAWPQRPHTELVEQLAEDLVQFCLADERVEACRVVVRKPEAYAGRAVPEITVFRCRAA